MTTLVSSRPPLWTSSFILICLSNILLCTAFYLSMPVFPLFLEDRFAMSSLWLGLAMASYTATAIITRPPTGYSVDKYGRRNILWVSYALFAALYAAYPLADSQGTITLVRGLHGMVWGVVLSAANTAAVDLIPVERRGEGIGFFGLGIVLGIALGPALGIFLAESVGYDTLFRIAAGITFIGFTMVLFMRFPYTPDKTVRPFSFRGLLEPTSMPVSLTVAMYCIAYGTMVNYVGVYARTLPHASAGVFFAYLAAGTGISRLLAGRMFDRSGPVRVMGMAYGFMALGFVSLALGGDTIFFNLAGLSMGLGFGSAVPITQAMVNNIVSPERRGAANATLMTFFDVGICLGLVITTELRIFLSWPSIFLILLLCIGTSAAMFRFWAVPHYDTKRRAR